jgi:hypothetical protein
MGTAWKPETKKKKARERDKLIALLEVFREHSGLTVAELIFVLHPTIKECTYRTLRSQKSLPSAKNLKLLKQAVRNAAALSGTTVKRDGKMVRIKERPKKEVAPTAPSPRITSTQAKAEASILKCKAKCGTCGAAFELETGTNVAGSLPLCPCGGKLRLTLGRNGA